MTHSLGTTALESLTPDFIAKLLSAVDGNLVTVAVLKTDGGVAAPSPLPWYFGWFYSISLQRVSAISLSIAQISVSAGRGTPVLCFCLMGD